MTLKTEQQELVSIVVPVYNVESYLNACLDSLIGQTYQKIEILLIDDGSTDRSGEICDAYGRTDPRVKVWHRKNQGVSAARNHGIREAKGKWLIFADSDDKAHTQLVELYMEYAEEETALLCDVASDGEFLKNQYTGESVVLEETDIENFMELFRGYYINSPFNKLYLTNILRENRICFPEGNSLGEDLLFNLEYFRHVSRRYRILHIPLYYYREDREGSLSTSYNKKLFETQQESFSALKQFLEEQNVWKEKNEQFYYEVYWDRLYLTARIYRKYERFHPNERRLKEILNDPIWNDIWKECKRRKLTNWKRQIKAAILNLYRWAK